MMHLPSATIAAFRRAQSSVLLCCIIVILGAAMRIHNYAQYPQSNWTADEYAFTWSGMSLIEKGYPESWSWLSPYGEFAEQKWNGNPYKIVRPWFDHPPLFSLLIGAVSLAGGAREYFDVTLEVIRIPMVVLGILNVVLVFLLSMQLFNKRVAVLASLVYALNPSVVYLSRLVVSENLLVTFLLLILILFFRALSFKHQRWRYLIPAMLLAAAASWVKIPGVSLVVILAFLCLHFRIWKAFFATIALGVSFLLLQLAYGAAYDLHLFLQILQTHADRFSDFTIMKNVLMIDDMSFKDLFSLYGLIILLPAATIAKKNSPFILLPVCGYIFTLLWMGAQSHWYAWYQIPLFPMFAICFGVVTEYAFRDRSAGYPLIQVLLLFSWAMQMLLTQHVLFDTPDKNIAKYVFVPVTLFLFAVFVLAETQREGKLRSTAKAMHVLTLAFYFSMCMLVVWNFDASF